MSVDGSCNFQTVFIKEEIPDTIAQQDEVFGLGYDNHARNEDKLSFECIKVEKDVPDDSELCDTRDNKLRQDIAMHQMSDILKMVLMHQNGNAPLPVNCNMRRRCLTEEELTERRRQGRERAARYRARQTPEQADRRRLLDAVRHRRNRERQAIQILGDCSEAGIFETGADRRKRLDRERKARQRERERLEDLERKNLQPLLIVEAPVSAYVNETKLERRRRTDRERKRQRRAVERSKMDLQRRSGTGR